MRIFKWKTKGTYVAVGLFVLAFAFGLFVRECSAAEVEVSGGVGLASLGDNCENAPVGEISYLAYDRHLDVSVGWVGDQQDCEGTYDVGHMTYASVQGVVHPLGHEAPWFLGLGLMALIDDPDGQYEILPQWWNFSLSVGVDLGRWRAEFRHFSNAGIEEPNRGQNHLLVGYRF